MHTIASAVSKGPAQAAGALLGRWVYSHSPEDYSQPVVVPAVGKHAGLAGCHPNYVVLVVDNRTVCGRKQGQNSCPWQPRRPLWELLAGIVPEDLMEDAERWAMWA